ncbi:hypothetical protein sscle_16g107960 [Sclerotinia sclerotiorum 1980 UF-70]|uniref:KaiA N-terminal domain-containing protein n=1 Tax=Sclerotinia sclerotiorum (strain ATCC 18683 / 1980 / Ss-1) TaxID=665079 RepID=A0A1D9QM65_SCLS1|nr:hypothetical protein sscle_16g107960 [Sclerotinia sclerotiorum 1980 UF-70]
MSSQQSSVPHGPDRQRILNVLAQRRYRQRKRERLHSLERRLDARLVTTNAMSASGGEIQPQHLMQPPLLRPGNPGTPNEPLYDLHPDSMIGACNASFTYLAPPYESACNTSSEISSLYVRDQFRINTPLPYGSTSQSATSTADSQLSAELQDLETSQFTFLSEHAIEIPNLKTLEVSLRIAHMLGLADDWVDLTINRVLDVTRISVPLVDLPGNLHPTAAQLMLPHYPVLDVLPWPSVRTKLICLFSQPEQLRPPIARGPMAIMQLMHALDDESEGLRVTLDMNGHGYDGKSWEVGQAIFRDWWWALDPEIVSNSNRLRSIRGVPKLQLPIP